MLSVSGRQLMETESRFSNRVLGHAGGRQQMIAAVAPGVALLGFFGALRRDGKSGVIALRDEPVFLQEPKAEFEVFAGAGQEFLQLMEAH